MSVWRIVFREISHRWLNFTLGLCSVVVAVGCVVGAETLLQIDRQTTEQILSDKRAGIEAAVAEREAAVKQAGDELKDAMRRHMKGLGFNVLILPSEQDLSELHLDGTLSETMPEQYVDKLANSRIMTINHLLPSVSKRIHWEEYDRDVILQGTRGEVPIMHRGLKKPLLEAVAPGKMVVGYEIHQDLGLLEGDTVTLLGQEFTVSTLHPERGSADDVTVWIDLAQAQEMLGMENLIHAILALECDCAGDRITQIRGEITGVLPGTQVIERYSQALARAEAREKAKQAATAALEEEKEAGAAALAREEASRTQLEEKHAALAGVLVPLAVLGGAVWIGLLAFGNARQRREEVGILRAIGLRSSQILRAFITKAVLIGLVGGVLGCLAGVAAGIWFGNPPAEGWQTLSSQTTFQVVAVASIVLAPVLAATASWLPAMLAARQDPAVVLRGD